MQKRWQFTFFNKYFSLIHVGQKAKNIISGHVLQNYNRMLTWIFLEYKMRVLHQGCHHSLWPKDVQMFNAIILGKYKVLCGNIFQILLVLVNVKVIMSQVIHLEHIPKVRAASWQYHFVGLDVSAFTGQRHVHQVFGTLQRV